MWSVLKRSDLFQGIIGQHRVVQALTKAIERDQVSHSYIFSGPRGTQKRETAIALAQALLTQGVRDAHPILHRIRQGNHPDLKEVRPEGASIRIHQIRSLIQDISIRPHEGKVKIYIIHRAHAMGKEAQNALLKTLEEPPAYGLIVLLTQQLSQLLPTIRSRSQLLKFNPLTEESIQEYLMEKFALDRTKARDIALMAKGSVDKAIQLCQGEDALEEREELLKRLLRVIKGDVMAAFSLGNYLKEHREDLEDWLDFIILWYRDVALYKELGDSPWIVHREYMDLLGEFSHYLSVRRIHDIIEEVTQSKVDLEHHVNLQLNMETMLLKMQEESHHG